MFFYIHTWHACYFRLSICILLRNVDYSPKITSTVLDLCDTACLYSIRHERFSLCPHLLLLLLTIIMVMFIIITRSQTGCHCRGHVFAFLCATQRLCDNNPVNCLLLRHLPRVYVHFLPSFLVCHSLSASLGAFVVVFEPLRTTVCLLDGTSSIASSEPSITPSFFRSYWNSTFSKNY